MARLKGITSPELSWPCFEKLKHRWSTIRERRGYIKVTISEIIYSFKSGGDNKASGPDFIPNKALKLETLHVTDIFAEIFS